jgi:probable DNA metabolism protein
MARFAWRVIAAAQKKAGLSSGDTGASAVFGLAWAAGPEARHGAEQAAFDRGDPDVRTVLEAAYKARHEIDRLMGLLRFSPRSWHGSPGGGPVYVARCSPDHYILPGLAEHFTRRFGDCPWAIIDEKRHLILFRQPGGEARLVPAAAGHSPVPGHPAPDRGCPSDSGRPTDDFEDLWRNYHRSVNNPDRNNPALQRQFMPRRYWKYLPELQ